MLNKDIENVTYNMPEIYINNIKRNQKISSNVTNAENALKQKFIEFEKSETNESERSYEIELKNIEKSPIRKTVPIPIRLNNVNTSNYNTNVSCTERSEYSLGGNKSSIDFKSPE